MGNGPGNIKEYIDLFYKYPSVQGGFAWEWANHGLLTKDKETGDEYYAYGGDFGEKVHDSTFVMDGLLDSDHTPNPGLIEYAKAIEPVQLLHSNSSSATFINRYDFITLDHLSLNWHAVNENGDESAKGELEIPSGVGPGQEFEIDLPKFTSAKSETVVHFTFDLKESTISLSKGWTVATGEAIVHPSHAIHTPSSSDKDLKVTTPSNNLLHIDSGDSKWVFSTLYGHLSSWTKDGKEIITTPPELSINRAQTDNDKPQDGWNWHDRLVHLAQPYTRKVSYDQPDKKTLEVTVHQQIVPPVLSWSIDVTITYTFSSAGTLRAHVKGSPTGLNLPDSLPRLGFVLELPHSFQSVSWFGRGPGESYRDSKFSQHTALHKASSIDALWTDYEVPQESSNRTDTRWVKLSSGSTSLLAQFVQGGERKLFDFQASHYRMDDVAASDHPYKLHKKKREEVVLRLDAVHHGLGTGSCGPKTLPPYRLETKDFEFEVLLQ
jgi:beta-galactosidase